MNMKTKQAIIDEQQFREDASYVLDAICHKIPYTKNSEPVRIEHGRYVDIGGPIGLDLDESGELEREWWQVIEKLEELGAFKIINRDGYGGEVKVNKPRLDELRKDFSAAGKADHLADIYYNPKTGIGYANKKHFHLKINQPEFKVFPEMYRNINDVVNTKTVARLLGDEVGLVSKANEIAKSLRRKTGLTKDEIVPNKGTLTLVGNKLDSPPI